MADRSGQTYSFLKGGCEISPASWASSGTLGCIVYAKDTNDPYILTNKHVVDCDEWEAAVRTILLKADAGARVPCSGSEIAKLREGHIPIFQPAYKGGGNVNSRIVAFISKRSRVSDAAVCEIIGDEAIDVERPCPIVGAPNFSLTGVIEPKDGMLVMKSGKQTGLTYDVANGKNYSVAKPLAGVLEKFGMVIY